MVVHEPGGKKAQNAMCQVACGTAELVCPGNGCYVVAPNGHAGMEQSSLWDCCFKDQMLYQDREEFQCVDGDGGVLYSMKDVRGPLKKPD